MSSPPTSSEASSAARGSLLANVSAVLIADGEQAHAHELTRGLRRSFEDVVALSVREPGERPGVEALRQLAAALAAAREKRVLVVEAQASRLTPRLWLGLTAWPEHDVVAPPRLAQASPGCALYRRDAVLQVVRSRLQADEAGERRIGRTRAEAMQGVLSELDVDFIGAADWAALSEERT